MCIRDSRLAEQGIVTDSSVFVQLTLSSGPWKIRYKAADATRAHTMRSGGLVTYLEDPNACSLTIEVAGHHERDRHTYYDVKGTAGGHAWAVSKRLVELRQLHDRVVAGLGRAAYEQRFAGVKFASHGGLPGTTGKLNKWCKKLFEVLQADGGGGGGGGAAVPVSYTHLTLPTTPYV